MDQRMNLPAALDSFVGRGADLDELIRLLQTARLVALTGAPGVGKTRLGLKLAAALGDRYPDGTFLVELAALGEPHLVRQAVAQAMSIPEQPGRDLGKTVAARLGDERVLLLLDNCEHLVRACADLATTLLGACPNLSVLATSREPLNIEGERIWRVAPLAAPGPEESTSPDVLGAYESVELFCYRAEASQPGFELTPANSQAVAEICRRLDGIPLAIELAAAMVGSLSPADIAANLDDRLHLLHRGSGSVLPRHRTLLEAIEWSHALLSSPEQALLRRLSVFAGGTTLEAAEAVCAGGELLEDDVLDALSSLVAKSLVSAITGTTTRYSLLETIRQFGRQELAEAGEEESTRQRHAHWCLELAERAEPELTGSRQQEWLDRIQADYANLRSALDWAVANDQSHLGLRLAGALIVFWRVRGYFSEGHGRLTAMLEVADQTSPTGRAKAVWGLGFMALMLGDPAGAIPAMEESIELFNEAGDASGEARAAFVLGNCLVEKSPDDALPILERSVDLARQAEDGWCLAHGLAIRGFAHMYRADFAEARAALEESIAVSRRNGEDQGLRLGLKLLADVAVDQGEYSEAEALLEEALGLLRRMGDTYTMAVALRTQGYLELCRGQFDRAAPTLEEGLNLARRAGNPSAVATALGALAGLAQLQGDSAAAQRRMDECLAVLDEAGAGPSIPALLLMGRLAQSNCDLQTARGRFEQALGMAQEVPVRPQLGAALHALGTVARSEGRHSDALELYLQGLRAHAELGQRPGIAQSLAALAGLAVASGQLERAARLLGAAEGLSEATGYALIPARQPRYEDDVAAVRHGLGDEELERAWAQGRAFSVEEAVEYATNGRGSRQRPKTGWDSLTNAERKAADLVGKGLSNTEIAERLFVAPKTVRTHLSNIYAKLGLSSRSDLALEAAAKQERPPENGLLSNDHPH